MRKIIKRTLKILLIILIILLISWIIFAQIGLKFRSSDAEAKKKFASVGVELFTHTLIIEGQPLHYARTGNDTLPTLLFIHGSPGSWDAFQGYMWDDALLHKFRMISVDRPGFGYSNFGHPKNLATQSALLNSLFEKLSNGKTAFLVGHSSGGPLIVKMAADRPTVYGGLVILAGSVDPAMEKKENWRPAFMKFPLKYLAPGAFRPSNEELWYLKKDLLYLKNEFQKVICPVFIIHGDRDGFVPLSNVDYAKRMLVNASNIEVKIIPGANHFIPWTKYEEIKEVLMRLGK